MTNPLFSPGAEPGERMNSDSERRNLGPDPNLAYAPEKLGANSLTMSLYWDHVKDEFFEKHNPWSSVVKFLKKHYDDITEDDIAQLRSDVMFELDKYDRLVQSSFYKKWRSFYKTSAVDDKYWISPDGLWHSVKEATHKEWISSNKDMLEKQGIFDATDDALLQSGWAKANIAYGALNVEVADPNKLNFLDAFVASVWRPDLKAVIVSSGRGAKVAQDPFPSLSSVRWTPMAVAARKIATDSALSAVEKVDVIEEFGPNMVAALDYLYTALKLGHSKDRAFEYASYMARKLRVPVSDDALVAAFKEYLKPKLS